MRPFAHASVYILFILLAVTQVAPVRAEPSAADDGASLARAVVDLTNHERIKAGLLPLKWNDALAAAGTTFAQDMATRGFFSHASPEGSSPVDRARQAGYPAYGWGGLFVGENLAKGYPTAEGAMQGWMNSEGHKANILNPKYREIGVGVALAPNGSRLWAQEFGSRPGVLTVSINGDAPTTDSPQVTLQISSEDVSNWGSLGTVTNMMVSNRPDFSGASWEPYSRTKAWTLGLNAGPQRVFVRLRDAGGATVDSSDEIRLTRSWVSAQSQSESIEFIVASSQPAPDGVQAEFKLGFGALAGQIPEGAGQPLEDEHYGANGDALQRTTRGLMVWRKADNWTAFTDGAVTWINGPEGLQSRPNDQKFGWES